MAGSASDHSRQTILALFDGQRGARPPCFSGLINVAAPGLESLGLHFSQVHADPARMAAAAATTHRMFGLEAAVVPLDMCVEAGALGAAVDFRAGSPRPEFPRVSQPPAASPSEFHVGSASGFTRRGRLPIVLEAIRRLKDDVGREIVVGAWVPGPMTLALYVIDPNAVLEAVSREPDELGRVLDSLSDLLAEVALAYRAAGADFITIHEMGGSPGFIGPRSFERLVQPRLKRLLGSLPKPRVLSVCGDTNRAMPLLAECGAEALNVDQLNDLARSRATLGPDALLFGNIDPVGVLAEADADAVRLAVAAAVQAGADAIWPGCDLWPLVPAANMHAMVAAARSPVKD